MDTNLIFSIFFALILIIITIEWDEGVILFLLGFLSIGMAINLDMAFSITNTSYQGFGQLIQLVYAFISVFAFAKIYYTAKAAGLDMMFGRVRKHG